MRHGSRPRALARTALRRVEGHARHAATVDANRRQDPPGADALAQSFLARRALRHGARADHVADPGRRAQRCRSISTSSTTLLLLATSDGQSRQVMLQPMTVADFYADVMDRARTARVRRRINPMPCEIADCIAFDQDRTHAAYDARRRQSLLARAARGARRAGAFPHRLPRQSRARCISSGARSIWR